MNQKKVFSSIVALVVGLGIVGSAQAQEAGGTDRDYCEKVQARAHADAWLLFSPSLQLQAIRYPASSSTTITVVGGSTDAHGDQVRGNLSWSPLDAYKGTVEQSVADKDCLQHSAMVEAQNLLETMNDAGRAPALQAEVSYLKMHSDDMNDILANMRKHLVIGHITIVDVATVQTAVDLLERKRAVSQGQLDLIGAKDYVVNSRSSSDIVERLQRYSMEFEKETSRLRMTDPWTIQASFGIVPPMAQVDGVSWYGSVSIGYNFGGLVRGSDENKYLSARQKELQHARYELADQIRRLQDGIRAGIGSADAEIATLEKRLADLNELRDQLRSHMDAPNVVSALSVVELQIMDATSDRLYLVELRRQLTEWK